MDITFAPGQKETKWVDIDVIDDDLLEPTESFEVSLTSSSVEDVKLGKPSTVNILDNDGNYVLIRYINRIVKSNHYIMQAIVKSKLNL